MVRKIQFGGIIKMSSNITISFGDKEGIQFEVPSSSSNEKYLVTWDFDNGWFCDCKGCMLGHHLCKHILACMDYMKFLSMAVLDDPRVFKKEVSTC